MTDMSPPVEATAFPGPADGSGCPGAPKYHDFSARWGVGENGAPLCRCGYLISEVLEIFANWGAATDGYAVWPAGMDLPTERSTPPGLSPGAL